MSKIEIFKEELHEILKKYNASITCLIEGDTCGLTYSMVVDFGKDDKCKEYELSDGATLDWNDI